MDNITYITVTVEDKIAQSDGTVYVCDNDNNYRIKFLFDDEWAAEGVKTARFKWGKYYYDEVFEGDEVDVPKLSGIYRFTVGVFAGDLIASTEAVVSCRLSVLTGEGQPQAPTSDVYGQIMDTLNRMYAIYGPENVQDAINSSLQSAKESGDFDGPKGDPGEPGYTPQRGKDYWTDSDKREIVEDVLSSGELPSGGDPNAVLYTAQVLTEEQQTQARKNIGAADKIVGSIGDFVIIGADGNVTTKTIAIAEEATY